MLVGIYKRKLVFFLCIGLLIFAAVKIAQIDFSRPEVTASIVDYASYYEKTPDLTITIDVANNGTAESDGQKLPEGVTVKSDREELRYLVMDQPYQSYESVEIILNLPKKINRLVSDPQIIAVHGASPDGAVLEDGKRIVYRALNVGQTSTVTIVAPLPRGYFDLPASKIVSSSLSSIPGLIWLILGLVLPPIAAFVLVYMVLKSNYRLSRGGVQGQLNAPPAKISAALVEAIVNGKVGPRTIMATLVDLSRRGYIRIFNTGKDFVIYRNRVTNRDFANLKIYEKTLLEKIFLPSQQKAASMDVEARIARHLFSRKVALFYLQVYDEAESLGYFTVSPPKIHLQYRLAGIATFFWGLIGYAFFAILAPDPKFVLFFWVSLILFGILIVNFAPKITTLSLKGQKARLDWLKFKNFMSDRNPLAASIETYEDYLPYSISLGVEADWSGRFARENFMPPKWYGYTKEINGIENFAGSFLPVIDYIADSLHASNEPLVR